MQSIRFIILLIVYFSTFGRQLFAEPNSRHSGTGVIVGAPYTIAAVLEKQIQPDISLQAHAGSIVIFSSAGLRLNYYLNRNNFSPYLFIGDAVIHADAQDYGDSDGAANYFWFGTGAKYRVGSFSFNVEVCALLGGNDEKGLGDDWYFPFSPAIGGGLKYHFNW